MSYSTNDTPQKPIQKDNRKLFYGLLITALVLTWAFLVILWLQNNSNKEAVKEKDTQIVTVTTTKDSIQQEFNRASAKLDSMNGVTANLQGELAAKNNDIIKLKQNINSILRKSNANAEELKQAKELIGQLNSKIEGLFAELEKTKAENQQLTITNAQLNSDKQNLSAEKKAIADSLANVAAAKKSVEEVASTLHASNLNIVAINVKSNGKENETTSAKKADLLRFTFDLDENRVAPSGNKKLYVIVYAPDGKMMLSGDAATFTTKDAGDKPFTSSIDVKYEQGKKTPVKFDYKQNGGNYQVGEYKIEIYHNGYMIGKGTKSLKKSGFLGL